MEHHGQPSFAGQRQLGAEKLDLRLTRAVVGRPHEVEPDFAYGLRVAPVQFRSQSVPFVRTDSARFPRMDAGRPQLDAATGGPVGVYVDVGGIHGGFGLSKRSGSEKQRYE